MDLDYAQIQILREYYEDNSGYFKDFNDVMEKFSESCDSAENRLQFVKTLNCHEIVDAFPEEFFSFILNWKLDQFKAPPTLNTDISEVKSLLKQCVGTQGVLFQRILGYLEELRDIKESKK